MKVGLSATMVQGGRSGVAQYVFALVREFIKTNDIDLTLFILKSERDLFDFAKDACRLELAPESASGPVQNILWHQMGLPGRARKLGLDALHVPSYRRLIHSASCPLVGTIHDLAPFHLSGKYDFMRSFYGKVVAKKLARRQDDLIAVSHDTAGDINAFFGIPQDQINVIHNGIDHERFRPADRDADRAEMARRCGLEKPYLLYVSRLEHPAKNHVRLIEAFEKFKVESGSDWELALGGGDWHGADVIREAAASSCVAGSIRMLGFVPDDDLPALYRAAEGMVYPSLFEGFGLPPVEAMACGTPVISSTRGALKEVVADAALVVDPESPDDIATAITRLATEDGLANALHKKGLANAARFRWDLTANKTAAVYAAAIARGS